MKKIITRAKMTYFAISVTSNAALFFFGAYLVNDVISFPEKCSTKEVMTVLAIIAMAASIYVMVYNEYKIMNTTFKDIKKQLKNLESKQIEL